MRRILVLGIGDIGSAVAHRLFRAGELAVIQDDAPPATGRRRMAFSDAIFDGEAQLTGVLARHVAASALSPAVWTIRFIPVTSSSSRGAIVRLAPDVIVDARMREAARPARLRRLARLTIGLGPRFVAGDTVDVAVDTSADNPGRILRAGAARPILERVNGANANDREICVYAARPGLFTSEHEIGDTVRRGEPIAKIGRRTVAAPLSGRLRGLARSGVAVAAGDEIAEIVPPGRGVAVVGIGERPRRIAETVLKLVRELRG